MSVPLDFDGYPGPVGQAFSGPGAPTVPSSSTFPGGHIIAPTPVKQADLGVLIALPILSVALLIIHIFQPVVRRSLPPWLQPFAQYDGYSDENEGSPPRKGRRWTAWTYLLGVVCIGGVVLAATPTILVDTRQPVVVLEVMPWCVAALMWAFERPTKTPRLILLQLLLIFVSYVARYSVHFLNHSSLRLDPFRLSQVIFSLAGMVMIGNMPLRPPEFSSSKIGSPKKPPSSALRSPEDNLTLIQFFTMKWVNPLNDITRKRSLVIGDVWQLPFEFQHTRLYLAFGDLKGSLLKKLARANGLDLAISMSCSVLERVAEVSSIRLTAKLYQALDRKDYQQAVFWVIYMFVIDGGRQLAKTTANWYSRKSYERSRGETFIALFSKLLTRAYSGSDMTEKGPSDDQGASGAPKASFFSRWFTRRREYTQIRALQPPLKEEADQPASNSKVVNLVGQDTYEISQRFWELCRLVSAPFKIGFTGYYLVSIMGWPSMVGVGAMLIFFGINTLLVQKNIQMERQRTKHTDKRTQAITHFINASRPLKLNGWTDSWKQRILDFRKLEMRKRLHMSYVTALIGMTTVTGGMLYPLASIGLYTLIQGQRLPNEVIWPSLQLFAQLEVSVKEAFDLIAAFWKTTIPVDRVNKFMDEPDRDEHPTTDALDIAFEGASFAWPATEKPVLRELNLTFPSGLTVVKGKVGSGKSSLLLAALNEMDLLEGNLIRPSEPVAYAQQLPWLQNKTIRENIVFHQRWDPARYKDTLYACALGPDLADLPDGDKTKLEEEGTGLSGGQKARVALARAVYTSCRILLLDDPLAALDHDTASLIVRRFLQGPLATGRTIVMVTHRDELVLPIADQVVEIEEGRARILSTEEIQEELEHPHNSQDDDAKRADLEARIDPAEMDEDEGEPEEAGLTGTVKWRVYFKYMSAGRWYLWLALAVFYVLCRLCDIGRAQLLESWGKETAAEFSSHMMPRRFLGLPDPDEHPRVWIGVLGAISLGQVASYSIAQFLLARITFHAASGLFNTAVGRVSKATFRYHDTTPSAQLRNRFIKDMGMVDGGILSPLEGFMYNLIQLIMSVLAIVVQQPALLVLLALVGGMFVYFFWIFTPTSRCLRRMEMRYLSPIISNIGIMENGLVTIRALRAEHRFQDRHLTAVDNFQQMDHFFWSMQFWLDFRLSMTTAFMRAALILFLIWWGTAASAIGFVLTQATVAMVAVQQCCEKYAQLQLDAISLERVDMLNWIPEEPNGDEQPPEDWPRPEDSIRFEDMSFQYDDDLPKVLNGVSFEIPGGSTCAVLGRTGSGKSTIANALLATQTPSSGTVKIGDYDLSLIDRTVLRNRVTFIQQDPTLFPGTLRDNIDPQGRFSDAECTKAVSRVLGPEWSLDTPIDAAGKNLSQGQRQLVSIGRAIVRRSGLVILDEATASIDRATAAKVQKLLREELAGSTVITIAHRLEAVEDANWCLRLEHGQVKGCGPAKGLKSR